MMRAGISTWGAILAAVVTAGAPSAANALVVTTTVDFTGSASVADQEEGGVTSTSGVDLGSSSVAQFDPTTGVLTGATLNLASTRTQSVQVTSTAGGGSHTNNNVTSFGDGSSSARLTAAGVDHTFAPINGSDACSDKRKHACDGAASVSSVTTNLTAGIAASALNSYVGSGSVTVARTAPTLSANQVSNEFTGTESTANRLAWNGQVGATYEYLLHAAAGLSSVTLDFGTLFLGDPAATLAWSISNLMGERVGLDLDGFDALSGPFSSDLHTFADLAAGSALGFTAMMDTSVEGIFTSTYRLLFSDADIGAASSRLAYTLDLTLTGIVAAPAGSTPASVSVTAVPEPGLLSLLGIGLAGLASVRRRRS